MLREESEDQAKRMSLPLLTLFRIFWLLGCHANTKLHSNGRICDSHARIDM